MKKILMTFTAAIMSSTFALADTPVTSDQGQKIKAALDAFGCSGGKMEKDSDGSFEVDDAKCKDGQYEIKLDKNFKLISISRDK